MLQNHGQNFHFKFNQRWENIKNHRNKDNIWNLEKIGIWYFLIIELLTFKIRFFVLIFRNVLILKFGFFLS